MELTMSIRRSLIDQAIENMMARKERIRVAKPQAPAEDCEFPEESPQEFPEYEADPEWED